MGPSERREENAYRYSSGPAITSVTNHSIKGDRAIETRVYCDKCIGVYSLHDNNCCPLCKSTDYKIRPNGPEIFSHKSVITGNGSNLDTAGHLNGSGPTRTTRLFGSSIYESSMSPNIYSSSVPISRPDTGVQDRLDRQGMQNAANRITDPRTQMINEQIDHGNNA